ncbi:MAG TPA: Re/Si-specific NAD(P)(+) transhydrogenase subunit alpha [Acidimicrobiales bacterium]|nr:Re/Si-specific NAD(P)(+) transhydrogenase subunit alpha [Acidimicrobiales bacterium]
MRVGIPSERAAGERRVAIVPEVVPRLLDAGHEVLVERGAGAGAFLPDVAFAERGAELVDGDALFGGAEILCKVQPPSSDEVARMRPNSALVSFLQPQADLALVEQLRAQRVSAFSLDLLPRISRAQSMDALSSQALVGGYAAVLLGASRLSKFFPMFMTAAGTVPPAKVLVIGAGVAGLQAIATARRLGALVRGHDVRPAAREEVESLGATFVALPLESLAGEGGYARVASDEFLDRQRELIAREVAASDVVITTAAVPGRPAPLIVTTAMVEAMTAGSVIVDLAAESGGNCEVSRAGEEVLHGQVRVIGVQNLPSSVALHASFLYARNVAAFLALLAPDAIFAPDFADELVSGTCVTHRGEIVHAPTRELVVR